MCGEGLHFFYSIPEGILVIFSVLLSIRAFDLRNLRKGTVLATFGVLLSVAGLYGAEDLFTSYVCFEIAGFLSVFWIFENDRTANEMNETAKEYLGWIVITGMIMTMGMFLVSHFAGTLEYESLSKMGLMNQDLIWTNVAAVCYLVGYGTRCGMIFFHSWMDTVVTRMPSLYRRMVLGLFVPSGISQFVKLYPVLYNSPDWTVLLEILIVWTVILYIGKIAWRKKNKEEYLESLGWISMEKLIYRPFFCQALPFVFGILFRILDYLPDSIVAWLRGSIYRDSKQRVWDKVGTPFTYIWGVVFDEFANILNQTILRRHPIQKSFVNGFAVAKKEWEGTTRMITKSVSFGLLMFCIGMCITLVYLFF
jgi:hypothetical protein